MSGRQWRKLASRLAESGLRAIVPDLTGHGKSPEWPEGKPFSFQIDVERVAALLESLDEPAHLVGHSYGGFIALQTAIAAPSRIRSLALFDPVAFGTLDDAAHPEARRELRTVELIWDASPEGRERWLSRFVDYWGGTGAWAGLREDLRAEFRRVAWVVFEGVKSLASDRTPASAYAILRAPALLLTGEHSPVAARTVIGRLRESLAGARVETVPGAGHMAPLTHADAVNELIFRSLAV
jgi:pimeloyl-ACP methyl ester carboxylesterase